MTSYARADRAALCALLDELGPDAPTLCEGWATRDLAAHLAVREGRPDAAAGIVVAPLAGWTKRVQDHEAAGDWARLVDRVRSGPPWWNVTRVGAVDEQVNLAEFFVHLEDVRRAQPSWQPRELGSGQDAALWRMLKTRGRMLFRSSRVGVALRTPDGRECTVRDGEPTVTLVGPVGELVMYAFGRRGHARVEVEGDPAAVATFAGTPLGL